MTDFFDLMINQFEEMPKDVENSAEREKEREKKSRLSNHTKNTSRTPFFSHSFVFKPISYNFHVRKHAHRASDIIQSYENIYLGPRCQIRHFTL